VVNLTYHIGALGALLDGLEEEAGRLAVVLLDEAPVREHRRQVVGEDAPLQRQQVASLLGRGLELCLLLPHRCAGRGHITRVNQSEISSRRKHNPPGELTDGVELVERGCGAAGEDSGSAPAAVEAQRRRRRRREAGGHGRG